MEQTYPFRAFGDSDMTDYDSRQYMLGANNTGIADVDADRQQSMGKYATKLHSSTNRGKALDRMQISWWSADVDR